MGLAEVYFPEHGATSTCDFCQEPILIGLRWHVLAPRANGVLTEVMWSCATCAQGTPHTDECYDGEVIHD